MAETREQVEGRAGDRIAVVGRTLQHAGAREERIAPAAARPRELQLERHAPSGDVVVAEAPCDRVRVRPDRRGERRTVGDVAALAGGAAPPRDALYWTATAVAVGVTIAGSALLARIATRALRAASLDPPDDPVLPTDDV